MDYTSSTQGESRKVQNVLDWKLEEKRLFAGPWITGEDNIQK